MHVLHICVVGMINKVQCSPLKRCELTLGNKDLLKACKVVFMGSSVPESPAAKTYLYVAGSSAKEKPAEVSYFFCHLEHFSCVSSTNSKLKAGFSIGGCGNCSLWFCGKLWQPHVFFLLQPHDEK